MSQYFAQMFWALVSLIGTIDSQNQTGIHQFSGMEIVSVPVRGNRLWKLRVQKNFFRFAPLRCFSPREG